MTIGFRPPPPGTRMCSYVVAYDGTKRINPRPCKRAAKLGGPYCGRHTQVAATHAPMTVSDGGFCVACGQAARSYKLEGITIALCGAHGKALSRAIREGR